LLLLLLLLLLHEQIADEAHGQLRLRIYVGCTESTHHVARIIITLEVASVAPWIWRSTATEVRHGLKSLFKIQTPFQIIVNTAMSMFIKTMYNEANYNIITWSRSLEFDYKFK